MGEPCKDTCLLVVVVDGGDAVSAAVELKMGMDMVRWCGLLGRTGFPKKPPIGGDFFRMYGGNFGVSKLIPEMGKSREYMC